METITFYGENAEHLNMLAKKEQLTDEERDELLAALKETRPVRRFTVEAK